MLIALLTEMFKTMVEEGELKRFYSAKKVKKKLTIIKHAIEDDIHDKS